MDIEQLFASYVADINSVPFEHEDYWTDRVGELRTEDTRG